MPVSERSALAARLSWWAAAAGSAHKWKSKVQRVRAGCNERACLCERDVFTHLRLLTSAQEPKPILFSKRFSPIFCDTSKAKMEFYSCAGWE